MGTPSAKASKAKYGGIPSWLPKATVRVNRVVTATAAHPELAIEGDTVAVHLPRGRVIMTAVGPAVPEEGRFPIPETTPCRFAVTLAAVRGGGPAPVRVAAGHPVSLTLSAVLPTGNGQLRWTPLGGRPIVSWDFDVEIE